MKARRYIGIIGPRPLDVLKLIPRNQVVALDKKSLIQL